VRRESKLMLDDTQYVAAIDLELDEYGDPGFWYPRSIVFEQSKDGGTYIREVIDVVGAQAEIWWPNPYGVA